MARYGKKAQQKVKQAMHERKRGTLKSGRSGRWFETRETCLPIKQERAPDSMRGGDLNRVASEALQRVSGTNVARGEVGEAPDAGQGQNGVDPEGDTPVRLLARWFSPSRPLLLLLDPWRVVSALRWRPAVAGFSRGPQSPITNTVAFEVDSI